MDLLLLSQNNKFHHVYMKYFSRFMFNKTKYKTKNHFLDTVYNALVMKGFYQNIKKCV